MKTRKRIISITNSLYNYFNKISNIKQNRMEEKKLYIFSLHSTSVDQYNVYEKVLEEINSIAEFINPNDIESFFQNENFSSSKSILTIDDGLLNNYDFANKVLKKLNIKAIFFIIPYYLVNAYENEEYFHDLFPIDIIPKDISIINQFRHLSIVDIESLVQQGHLIGVHGYKHESATSIKIESLIDFSKQSNSILSNLIYKPENYCYPFGSANHFSKKTNGELKNLYKFLHTSVRGYNSKSDINRKVLKRHPISIISSNYKYKCYDFKEVFFFAFNPLTRIPIDLYHNLKQLLNNLTSRK